MLPPAMDIQMSVSSGMRHFPLRAFHLSINSEDKEGQDIDADEVYEECSQGCQGVRLLIGYYRFFTSFRMTNINQLAEKKKGRFKEATYKSRLYTSLCF